MSDLQDKLEELRAKRPEMSTPAYKAWLLEYREMLRKHILRERPAPQLVGRGRLG